MKIPVVAPVTFVIPPVSVNVAKAPDTPPVKYAVTVPEDATVAVAFIQRDTAALTLSEHTAGVVNTPQLTTTVVVAVHVPTVAVSV